MWVIVAFMDDIFVAVPISWVINCNGEKKCFWPLQDERNKRSRNVPPSFVADDGWELHDCVLLLNGAIYDDFEEALGIEIDGIDNDKNANERPKLSWEEEENEIENTENVILSEATVANEDLLFSEFHELLNRPDLCSTRNEVMKEHNLQEVVQISSSENYASVKTDSEMLDTILKNQEEKKKILIKLMTRMYSLESAIGYNPS